MRDRRNSGDGKRLDLDFGEFNRWEKFLTGTMYGSEDPAVALLILLGHARAGRLRLKSSSGRRIRSIRSTRLRRLACGLPRPCSPHPVVVEGLVERIWPGAEAVVEPLGGGITNHNFKVEVGGEAFVLRIGGKDTELLGIDREHEHDGLASRPHRSASGPRWSRSSTAASSPRFVDGTAGRARRPGAGRRVGMIAGPRRAGDPVALRFVPRRRGLPATAEERGVGDPVRLRRGSRAAQPRSSAPRRGAAPSRATTTC